jgi:hypothetical protein
MRGNPQVNPATHKGKIMLAVSGQHQQFFDFRTSIFILKPWWAIGGFYLKSKPP